MVKIANQPAGVNYKFRGSCKMSGPRQPKKGVTDIVWYLRYLVTTKDFKKTFTSNKHEKSSLAEVLYRPVFFF